MKCRNEKSDTTNTTRISVAVTNIIFI